MFSALLKYWRGQRGLSQLDLSLTAGVSARHVSYLESGRAQPGELMVLRLMRSLDVPLRDQNHALRAAGFEARFAEPVLSAIAPAVDAAITRMMKQHEPYPMTALAPDLTVLRSNNAAISVFSAFVAEPSHVPAPLDMISLLFDPRLVRPFVTNWAHVGRAMIDRLSREALHKRSDPRINTVIDRALGYPDVPRDWREPALGTESEPTLTVRLRRGEMEVGFLIAVTVFSAPQQVTLEELKLESCFPLDEATTAVCERLSREG